MKLQGKKVVLLGGTSGIGLAVAQAATDEGAEAVIASSNPGRVNEALAVLPAGSTGRVVDLLDANSIARFFETVGAFDHLVYTAGEGLKLSPLAAMSLDEARTFFELRYWGALGAAKAAQGKLRPGGSIIFTSGIAGARPGPGWSVAASICSAMEGLTRALAVELAPLRVNIVSPGVVRSPLWRDMDDGVRSAFYADQADRLPVRHVGEPEEVAQAYVYLMAQTYGTGQTLVVDGGGVLV
ncbi:SDR family oxidoreductase [Chelatococcus sambhunathii]|uniref:SDR family oxidoreductase n=1 Tax=Chelatococcus sambhunathii TaxID=363953 RepID=A0ABU1DEP7_9HYPH|nr:SDR family oxidoreductase [Chelatococcus sambhunathii]MDR4306585.1 SDR family oxidoreductase [Chelatococcus sambhunathii]